MDALQSLLVREPGAEVPQSELRRALGIFLDERAYQNQDAVAASQAVESLSEVSGDGRDLAGSEAHALRGDQARSERHANLARRLLGR